MVLVKWVLLVDLRDLEELVLLIIFHGLVVVPVVIWDQTQDVILSLVGKTLVAVAVEQNLMTQLMVVLVVVVLDVF